MPARSHIFDCPGTHIGVREAASTLRLHLASLGVDEKQQSEWELLAVEAGNNAVQHSPSDRAGKESRIRFITEVADDSVEVAVTDYSRGFDLPEEILLPDDDSEHGRGLFLISAFSDSIRYLRGLQENFLVMRKDRPLSSLMTDVQRGASVERTMHLMTEELSNTYESLSAIFRFSSEISLLDNITDCAEKWMSELLNVTGCSWYVFRQFDGAAASLNLISSAGGRVACPATLPLEGESQELSCIETASAYRGADILFDGTTPQQMLAGLNKSFGLPLSGICHPIFIRKELFGVLTLGTYSPISTLSAGQINVTHTFADLLSVQINNLRSHQTALQTREVTRELQVAAGIQRSLLPQTLPQPPGFEIAAHSWNARQVGGDFYDVIAAGPGGYLLAIADVMGKGVPAAMFAAIFRSHLRARPELLATPGRLMRWLNRVLFADLDSVDMFITAQLAYLDTSNRVLALASAGHCPAMLVGSPDHSVRLLSGNGPPLGINPQSNYDEQICLLPPQSRLLMYTDGLVEFRNGAGNALGDAAVTARLIDSSKLCLPASSVSVSLLDLVGSHSDVQHLNDDITHLIFTETVLKSSLEGNFVP